MEGTTKHTKTKAQTAFSTDARGSPKRDAAADPLHLERDPVRFRFSFCVFRVFRGSTAAFRLRTPKPALRPGQPQWTVLEDLEGVCAPSYAPAGEIGVEARRTLDAIASDQDWRKGWDSNPR